MIVFTKDTQYNQCKREDILNFQNQKYINSLKHELEGWRAYCVNPHSGRKRGRVI